MKVTNGRSRCQVKRIDGVDYCLNFLIEDEPIALIKVYKMWVQPSTSHLFINGFDMNFTSGGGYEN